MLRVILYSVDEIDDHRNVDNKDDNSADADVLHDLIYFKWDERGGGNDRQILCPVFFEQQSDAFSPQQCRVEKTSGADRFELMVAGETKFHHQPVNVMVIVVNVQHAEEVHQCAGDIFVKQ